MSIPLENWGQLKFVTSSADVKREGEVAAPEVAIQLMAMPKGRDQSSPFVPKPILTVPVPAISSASGTTKNDISLALRPKASVAQTDGQEIELTSMRFAVPNVCVGHEQTEEAGKEILQEIQQSMKEYQKQVLGSGKGTADDNLLKLATHLGGAQSTHADETVVAAFDDVILSYPSGKFKIVLSNYHVVLEDKRRGASGGLLSFPLTDIQQLYLCDVPSYFSATQGGEEDQMAQYVVVILKNPLKVRTATYAHVVISCPPSLVLDEAHPWKCELATQEEINAALHFPKQEEGTDYPLVPTMSGRVSEILIRTFKAVAKVPAYGGVNKEYRSVLTQGRQSCMRCLFRGAEGFLYIVNGGFLFLHRPATKISFGDVSSVELDESESGTATFQLSVFARGTGSRDEKYVFSGIDKAEKENLLSYLDKKVKLIRRGVESDAGDDEEDEDESAEDDEEEEDDEFSGDDDDDDSDDEENKDAEKKHRNRHHRHKRDRSEKSEHKKHKKDKKHKKHHKEKKEKHRSD